MVKPVIVAIADSAEVSRTWMLTTKDALCTSFEVLGADDMDSLVQRLSTHAVEAIVMAVTAGTGAGYDWLEVLRQDPNYDDIPILVLLNEYALASQSTLLRLGADWIHVYEESESFAPTVLEVLKKQLSDIEFVKKVRERVARRGISIEIISDKVI
ncbi:MAG: hypothetical protein H3C47_02860 [Candidatus Cloacimonetes bacterium]|nr:hypothetical protein [Candidatus Cloacimonadota bacterium]